ncbi:hypothetical protein DID88_004259 [Monilinia fructigena]|uniref:Spherulation-specific family 4 n=1 Tax=Monilinia fructigena TaxID=38457 RepID=A0A395IS94_9HELO|nr:hypothetical protein DID88_004259 [Monilinia fructigena]
MVLPVFVFLPLYMYPYNSTSWSTLTTSIVSNPNLKFHIVVSPNLAFTDPDSNYVAGLSILKSHANVLTLGYVYTSYGLRDISEIEADINKYVEWNKPAKIPIDGIFFDESPSNNSTFSYMSTLSSYAKTSLGAGKDHVFLNPGVPVDASFYTLADSINVFEESYSKFNKTALNSLDRTLLAKSTYAIHDFTGTAAQQTDLISKLASANLAGMLITTQPGYTAWSSLWSSFCSAVSISNLSGGIGEGRGNGDSGGNNGGHNGGHGGGDYCDDDDDEDDDDYDYDDGD